MPRRFGSFCRRSLGQVDRSHQPRKGAIFALRRHRFLATGGLLHRHAWLSGRPGRAGHPSGNGRLEGDLAIRQAFECQIRFLAVARDCRRRR